MTSDDTESRASNIGLSILDRHARSLYLLFLKGQKLPPREEVRKLHPSIVDVRVPRQKSARFCFIQFESEEAAEKAKVDLEKLGRKRKFRVSYVGLKRQGARKPTSDAINSKRLFVNGLPPVAQPEILKNLFPNCVSFSVKENEKKGKRFGFVEFATVEEAQTALESSVDVCINGVPLLVTAASDPEA